MFSGSRFLRRSLALLLALAAPLAAQTVTIGNGTAAAPTLRPIGSPTTGLFRKGPDTLGIAASGRMAGAVRDSQFLFAPGRFGKPSISFLGASTTGFSYLSGLWLIVEGSPVVNFNNSGGTIPQAQFASGSASFPSIAFNASSQLGLYRVGADTLGFSAKGRSALMVVDSALLVHGAGTASCSSSRGIIFTQAGNSDYKFTRAANSFSLCQAASEIFRWNSSQLLAGGGSAGSPAYSFLTGSDLDLGMYRAGADTLGFTAGGVQKARIHSNGLEVVSSRLGMSSGFPIEWGITGTRMFASSGSNIVFEVNSGTNTLTLSGGANATLTGGAGDMTITAGTGASRNLTLRGTNSSGVAINAQLVLSGADSSTTFGGRSKHAPGTAASPGITFSDDQDTGLTRRNGDNANDSLTVIVNSVVGPSFKQDTVRFPGKQVMSNLTAASGTPNSVCIDATTKQITENAATSCVVSSARFKTDIKLLPNSEANRIVMGLKPSTFTYRDGGRKAIGLIAEQADSVDSRLASRDAQGRANSVNYEQVTILLLSTVQQLRAEVDSLKKASGHGFGSACKKIGTTPTGMAILECPASP